VACSEIAEKIRKEYPACPLRTLHDPDIQLTQSHFVVFFRSFWGPTGSVLLVLCATSLVRSDTDSTLAYACCTQ